MSSLCQCSGVPCCPRLSNYDRANSKEDLVVPLLCVHCPLGPDLHDCMELLRVTVGSIQ